MLPDGIVAAAVGLIGIATAGLSTDESLAAPATPAERPDVSINVGSQRRQQMDCCFICRAVTVGGFAPRPWWSETYWTASSAFDGSRHERTQRVDDFSEPCLGLGVCEMSQTAPYQGTLGGLRSTTAAGVECGRAGQSSCCTAGRPRHPATSLEPSA